mmetsp:Transcript_9986/g.37236  ORF Transcript_9986/g.37236 Transcript_9986/m.37236 type:complete len:326 (-) Transcript_9986:2586-3563(-)
MPSFRSNTDSAALVGKRPCRFLRIHPSHIGISRQIANFTGYPLLPSWQIPWIVPEESAHVEVNHASRVNETHAAWGAPQAEGTAKNCHNSSFMLAERLNAIPSKTSSSSYSTSQSASVSQFNGIFTKYMVEERGVNNGHTLPRAPQEAMDADNTDNRHIGASRSTSVTSRRSGHIPPRELTLSSLRHSNFIIYGLNYSSRFFIFSFLSLNILQWALLFSNVVFMIWTHWEMDSVFPVGRVILMVMLMTFEVFLGMLAFVALSRHALMLLSILFGLHLCLLMLHLLQLENVLQFAYLVVKVGVCVILWWAREKLMMNWFTTSTLAE